MRGMSVAVLVAAPALAVCAVLCAVLDAGAAASAAPATPTGRYATFAATSPTTGTAALAAGFPTATYTGTAGVGVAASAVVRAGAGAGTAYGASTGSTYLTISPVSGTQPSTTTVTFATPTPPSGWSFVLGDIDAETVRITATGPGGALTAAQLGFQSGYSNLKPPGPDVTVWDPATSTLSGSSAAGNTDGAFGWFSPTAAITSLSIVSTTRVPPGPVLQFWIAGHLATLQGTVTAPEGGPLAGATVSLVPSDGAGGALPATPVTTVTDAQGAFAVPDLLAVPMVATVSVAGRPASSTAVAPTAAPAPVDPADPPDAGQPAQTVPVWDVPVVLLAAALPAVVPVAAPELAPTGIAHGPALAVGLGALVLGTALRLVARRRRGAPSCRPRHLL